MIVGEESEDPQIRAAYRRNWPGGVFRLGEEPDSDLVAGTPDERFAMVWRLTVDAWCLGGRSLPDYERARTPGVVFRASPAP